MDQQTEAMRLKSFLQQPVLSLEEARTQLYALVDAEQDDQDNDTFAAVYEAIGYYPSLYADYIQLKADLDFLQRSTHHTAPEGQRNPFIAPTARTSENVTLRLLGTEGAGFVLDLALPLYLQGSGVSHLGADSQRIEIFNSDLPELLNTPELDVCFEPGPAGWELAVTILPGNSEQWAVEARVEGTLLPLQRTVNQRLYFSAPDKPGAVLQLLCHTIRED